MTLAWAIIIVAILFLLHRYQMLRKALRVAGIVAGVLIVGILAWRALDHVEANWTHHQANVQFALQNECLEPSTGKVHPVSASGEPPCNQNETVHMRGSPIDQWAIESDLPTVPPGEYIVEDGDVSRVIGGNGTPAKLCVDSAGIRHCFLFTDGDEAFSSNAHAQEVKLSNGGKLVLFTADRDISADSVARSVALLANHGGELTNILKLTHGIEDYDIWNLPYISKMPILLTAYSIWDMDTECHVCAHRYTIVSYVYNPLDGKYTQFDELWTLSKYETEAKIFELERTRILSGLKAASDAEAARHLTVRP
jgi:hypothetical protein